MKKLSLTNLFIISMALVITACSNDSPKKQSITYYNVVFDSNGGSSVETQKVESGKTASKPSDPTKTSGEATYFDGWYSDAELIIEFDFATPITKETVLHAKWLTVPKGSYLVTFDSQCDTEIPDQIVKGGECAAEPQNVTKDGYALNSWLDSSSVEFNFDNPVTDSTDLTAKWVHSGIYNAQYDDDSLFAINVYEDLDAENTDGAW